MISTQTPSFSIIIPTLNEQRCLPNLLADLTSQTFKDFEVIIVDGNSEDKTIKTAMKFSNSFKSLSIITSPKTQVGFQRNLGSKKAKADRLIFMDADNRLPAYFLQGIKYRLEATDPDILTTWIRADSNHKKDQALITISNLFYEIQKTTKNPYGLEAMMCFKKNAFKSLGGFDDSLPWGEGSDLLRRAVQKNFSFEIAKNPKYTYSLRRLRKQGTLKSARSVAMIELARLRKKRLSKEKVTYLYPMEGGKYFDHLDKESTSRLKIIVNKLYQITPLSKAKPKKGILNRVIEKIRTKKE